MAAQAIRGRSRPPWVSVFRWHPRKRQTSCFEEFGFASWRPGQREAVGAALYGRDALIVMSTGGGKSLCYQLPGLASPDLTVVVSP